MLNDEGTLIATAAVWSIYAGWVAVKTGHSLSPEMVLTKICIVSSASGEVDLEEENEERMLKCFRIVRRSDRVTEGCRSGIWSLVMMTR